MTKTFKAIGLMSGTSCDGIDLALIESNGKNIVKHHNFKYLAYEKDLKEKLISLQYKSYSALEIKLIENELTLLHAKLVNEFLLENKIKPQEIDIIGFHGHTIAHDPKKLVTWQIGNGHLLARETKINVIGDFRSGDVANGGQGAPLVPIYHFYLFGQENKSNAVLNIGGISNITFCGNNNENDIEAFDLCFGNAPLDDLVKEKLNKNFDKDGKLAKKGKIDHLLADRILQNEIFKQKPPKSFDRNDFAKIIAPINNLKIEDALATFCHIHAKALDINLNLLSQRPKTIFICGGGRKNQSLMQHMKEACTDITIKTTEEINLNGDAIEAEAFAFLAIRKLQNLPISFKKTTGINNSNLNLSLSYQTT